MLVSSRQGPDPAHPKQGGLLLGHCAGCDMFLHSRFQAEADEVDQISLSMFVAGWNLLWGSKVVLQPLGYMDHTSAEDFTDDEFQPCSAGCPRLRPSGSFSMQEVISTGRPPRGSPFLFHQRLCRHWVQPDLLSMHMVTCHPPAEGHGSGRAKPCEPAAVLQGRQASSVCFSAAD